MNPFYRPQITDELLSAYIDGAVTNEEKTQIEKAVQIDANVAWRLESLRQTVQLLRSLPEVPLPRSFVLTEADVAPQSKTIPPFVTTARRISSPPQPVPQRGGFWESLRDFLQGGSPLLRNLATTGLAVWLVLFAATQVNLTRPTIQNVPLQEPASVASSRMIESTPVNSEVASATDTPSTTTENPAPSAPVNEEVQTFTVQQQAQPTAEGLAPLAAEPAAQEQQSQSMKAMGGGQPAGEQAVTQPGEDNSSGLGAILGADGQPSDTSAAGAQASAASAPTDTEMAASSMAAAALPSAEGQPESNTVSSSEVANSATTPASESPLVDAAGASASQPAPEQANVAAAPAAQVVESTPTQVVEPTPTSEPTVALAQPAADGQIETQVEQYAAPAEPTAVAMADSSTFNSTTQADQQRAEQPLVESTNRPYFDPMRMQLAQLVVALVTAVLALFWLGSHLGRRG
ncbi:MAG: hypothetical protein U0175_32985 [Caldilineaceae bacterium]